MSICRSDDRRPGPIIEKPCAGFLDFHADLADQAAGLDMLAHYLADIIRSEVAVHGAPAVLEDLD